MPGKVVVTMEKYEVTSWLRRTSASRNPFEFSDSIGVINCGDDSIVGGSRISPTKTGEEWNSSRPGEFISWKSLFCDGLEVRVGKEDERTEEGEGFEERKSCTVTGQRNIMKANIFHKTYV